MNTIGANIKEAVRINHFLMLDLHNYKGVPQGAKREGNGVCMCVCIYIYTHMYHYITKGNTRLLSVSL